MSTTIHPRRVIAGLALALAALLLTVLPGTAHAQTPTDDPAEAAAGWLVSSLTDDPAIDTGFGPSAGPTIDTLLALAATGVAAGTTEDIADWLETQAEGYTRGVPFDELEDAAYAGASAKLALALLVVDRDPRAVGGLDLIAQLEAREITDADDGLLGRYSDRSSFGDFSSPLTQSLALLALTRAGDTGPSDAAIAVLVDQACPDGGFPSGFAAETCVSSVDTTGFVVQALLAVGASDVADAAAAWLADVQADDGSFSSSEGTNTNSTGLAATALAATGRTDAAAAAASWIISVQDGCDTDSPGAIPFSAEDRGSVPLATAQAAFGLSGAQLATVSSAGAGTEVPVLDCPAPEAPVPAPPSDGDGDGDVATPGGEDASVDEPTPGDEDATVDEPTPETDVQQPTEVDAGGGPSMPDSYLLTLVLGAALIASGLVGATRHRHGTR